MSELRPLSFVARAYEELCDFPVEARKLAGRELLKVQRGEEPDDWKPIKTVGMGVNEVRVRNASGAYRVIHVAKFEEAIYVLHCFEKKSQRTSRADLELATGRYKELIRTRGVRH